MGKVECDSMTQRRKLAAVLLMAWCTYVVAYLCRVNLSTVLDKLADGLGVTVEYLGTASSVYFVTYAIGQLLNGFLGDRLHPHKFVMLALSMTGAINMILAFQKSASLFLVLWGLNGFCQSMFWGTLLRLLSCYASEGQRKNVSLAMSASTVVGYLSSWVVLSWFFRPYDSTPYFLIPGLLAFALIPFWCLLSKKLPFFETGGRKEAPPLHIVLRDFRRDRLYHLCVLSMLVGAIQEGAAFWLPMIFTTVLDLGEGSLFLLALIPVAKLMGVSIARTVLARTGENLRKAALMSASAGCAVTLVLLLTSRHTSVFTVLLIACLVAVTAAVCWFVVSYLPLCFAERNMVSTIVGIMDFSSYVGAAIMSGTLGGLLLRYGWPALPMVWMVLNVLSLLLVLTGAGACLKRKGEPRQVGEKQTDCIK